jgi:hypothetical protein
MMAGVTAHALPAILGDDSAIKKVSLPMRS